MLDSLFFFTHFLFYITSIVGELLLTVEYHGSRTSLLDIHKQGSEQRTGLSGMISERIFHRELLNHFTRFDGAVINQTEVPEFLCSLYRDMVCLLRGIIKVEGCEDRVISQSSFHSRA